MSATRTIIVENISATWPDTRPSAEAHPTGGHCEARSREAGPGQVLQCPGRQGAEVAHLGNVQEGPLPHPRARRRGMDAHRGRLREGPLSLATGRRRQAPAKGCLQTRVPPQRQRLSDGSALTSSSHSVRRRKPLSGLFIKFAARGDGVGV